MLLNLSIISACNNNCNYCFQKNSYHDLDMMFGINEIKQILKWAKGINEVGILGGEPTLHPQCVDICNFISQYYNVRFFTNLLTKTETLEQLVKIKNMNWLVNTTTNPELQNVFNENIAYLSKVIDNYPIGFGITLTGDVDFDFNSIENLVRIGKLYPNIICNYRIAFASPCHDKIFKLKNFDKSIKYFYDYSYRHTPYIAISFDCSVNSCFMSNNVYLRIVQDRRTIRAFPVCSPGGFEILVNRAVKYCSSCPDELFNINDYRMFENYFVCWDYITNLIREFIQEYGLFYCKTSKICTSKTCQGACLAAIANLVKQDKIKPEFIQKIKKLQVKYIKQKQYF